MSKWAEIRCDYMDDYDKFWRVDAWETDDDNEEGKVIACIDSITGRVIYIDAFARVDKYAQSVITEFINWLKDRIGVNLFDWIHSVLQDNGGGFL